MLAGAPIRFAPGARSRAVGFAAVAAFGLAGCAQTGAVATLQPNSIGGAMDRGEIHSPRSAAMALSSIEGAPDEVLARFRKGVTQEAGAREITISDPGLARYFLRGYLDAFPTDDGTSVRFVWDVFDASKRRVERLEDALDLPKSDGDPWTLVDEKVLSSMATRSAESIATYLASTPEAVAARLPSAAPVPGGPPVAGGAPVADGAQAAAMAVSTMPVNSSDKGRPAL